MKKLIILLLFFSSSIYAKCMYVPNKYYALHDNSNPCPQWSFYSNGKEFLGVAMCNGGTLFTSANKGAKWDDRDINQAIYGSHRISVGNSGKTQNTIYSNSLNHETQYKTQTEYSICLN
jgi:hypothetical protein